MFPTTRDFGRQWALTDPIGGINAPAAWDLQIGSAGVTVAVLDTGITQHPELAGRVLPGYDFISDPSMANDGGGRDNDPSDPGDNTGDNECGDGAPGEPSSWHGTFVSGLIAANTDNGVGIAGVDWNAKILPVRVLGRCGGTFDDIAAAILWAVGVPVAGAPLNPNPARVINLSLGGQSSCPQAIQDAINVALAQGVVVSIAAGNDSINVSMFAPANCAGVITVGASTRQGDRASYSNFGIRVDVSAPGGDGNQADWILSLSNDGTSGPRGPAYAIGIGTSFAAPHVAGVASLMLARKREPDARAGARHHLGDGANVQRGRFVREGPGMRRRSPRRQVSRCKARSPDPTRHASGHGGRDRVLPRRQGPLFHDRERGGNRVHRHLSAWVSAHRGGLFRLGRPGARAGECAAGVPLLQSPAADRFAFLYRQRQRMPFRANALAGDVGAGERRGVLCDIAGRGWATARQVRCPSTASSTTAAMPTIVTPST